MFQEWDCAHKLLWVRIRQVLFDQLLAVFRQVSEGNPPAQVFSWHCGAMLAESLWVEWTAAHAERGEGADAALFLIKKDHGVTIPCFSIVVTADGVSVYQFSFHVTSR